VGTDVGGGEGRGVSVGTGVMVGFEVGTYVGKSVGAAVSAALPAAAIQSAGSTQRSRNAFIAAGLVSTNGTLFSKEGYALDPRATVC